MPSKAKLTTRSLSTTSVSTDTIPKNASLTNSELDSNFLNLRDQTIAISDGSNSTDIEAGETITFSGASVSGNTVTITGGSGTDLQSIVVEDDGNYGIGNSVHRLRNTEGPLMLDATGFDSGSNWEGIWLAHNKIYVGQNSTNNDFTPGGNTGSPAQIVNAEGGDISLIDSGNGGVIIRGPNTTSGNAGRIELTPSGSGQVKIDNHLWPSTLGNNGQLLVTDGSGGLGWTNPSSASWSATYTLTDPGSSSTLNIDFNNGQTQKITFGSSTDSVTIATPSNLPSGRPMYLIVCSDNLSWTNFTMPGYHNEQGNSSYAVGSSGDQRRIFTIFYDGSDYYATSSNSLLLNP